MNETSVVWSEGKLALSERRRAFADWWISGLRESFPSAWFVWIQGAAPPTLLISVEGASVACRLVSGTMVAEVRIPADDFGPEAIKAWIAEYGLKREQVAVTPVLAADLFYLRRLILPKAAMGALARILEQEILRRTPFQVSEIWHGAVAVSAAAELSTTMVMQHWIIRRDRAETALSKIGLSMVDVDCLAVDDENANASQVIRFRAVNCQDPAWVRPARNLLAAAALGSLFLGVAGFDFYQSSVAASVEASLTASREAAAGVVGDQTSQLFAMKADVGFLDIWEELSRLLPEHTFLSEMSFKDRMVSVSGFSADAARLVRLIDESKIFTDAALTAAITPDTTEHKDRFSISFRVRDGRFNRPSNFVGQDHD